MKTTKYIFFLELLVLMIGGCFTACSDDDEIFENSAELYGIWEPAYAEGYEKGDGEEDTWSGALNASNNYDDYSRIEFDEDGFCRAYDYISGKWKLSGTAESYYVKDNKIFIDGDPATIVKLTSSELVVEIRETDINEGITYEYYEKVTYRKVN